MDIQSYQQQRTNGKGGILRFYKQRERGVLFGSSSPVSLKLAEFGAEAMSERHLVRS